MSGNQLTGEIPSFFKNFKGLGTLYLSENNFSGSLTSILAELNLGIAVFHNNPNLSGYLQMKRDDMWIDVVNTQIVICGSASANQPVTGFPEDAPLECLAVESSLRKRDFIGKYSIQTPATKGKKAKKLTFSCNNNKAKNPNQDCINAVIAVCKSSGPGECKKTVEEIFDKLNDFWKNFLRDCRGRGNKKGDRSDKCKTAIQVLINNVKYFITTPSGSKMSPLRRNVVEKIESVIARL